MLMIDLSSPIAFQNEYIHYSTPNVWTLAFTAAVAYLLAMIVGFWHIYAVQCCLDSYTFTCTHWPHNHNFNLIYCLIHFSRISLNGNFWCFIWQYVLKNLLFFLFLVNRSAYLFFSKQC